MNIEPKTATAKGPADWFTGDVWIDTIASRKPEPSRMVAVRVRFAPAARTAWHSHAHGQTLHVTAGVALMGTRDGTILEVHPGQTVYTPPGEEHWHGATPDDFMEHLALLEGTSDGDGATWLEHVGDEDYHRH
ncbi:cupin domain-containing protein [Jiangella aurantiaca]|uniref:Cupin domain-containing protein n=1 Tax=Jiangella aurantiaca TaxID=2530373 RepID=A0A4R5A9Y5_9ACTN|nr:cupin domain-containing protein [Jiangella aurantiaca]TDD66532.1 cupin domain-containing protein [Jiangella aurantiaca]